LIYDKPSEAQDSYVTKLCVEAAAFNWAQEIGRVREQHNYLGERKQREDS